MAQKLQQFVQIVRQEATQDAQIEDIRLILQVTVYGVVVEKLLRMQKCTMLINIQIIPHIVIYVFVVIEKNTIRVEDIVARHTVHIILQEHYVIEDVIMQNG